MIPVQPFIKPRDKEFLFTVKAKEELLRYVSNVNCKFYIEQHLDENPGQPLYELLRRHIPLELHKDSSKKEYFDKVDPGNPWSYILLCYYMHIPGVYLGDLVHINNNVDKEDDWVKQYPCIDTRQLLLELRKAFPSQPFKGYFGDLLLGNHAWAASPLDDNITSLYNRFQQYNRKKLTYLFNRQDLMDTLSEKQLRTIIYKKHENTENTRENNVQEIVGPVTEARERVKFRGVAVSSRRCKVTSASGLDSPKTFDKPSKKRTVRGRKIT